MNYKKVQLDRVSSTNVFALEHLAELDDKTIISADTQDFGHGRFDRKWFSSKPNNIYASIVLKPQDFSCEILSNLTQYMCVVLSDVLVEYGLKPEIKWPNDVLIDGKKIAGILAETSFMGQILKGFVLGIGVNLNLSKEDVLLIDQRATAVNLELRKSVDKDDFFDKLFDRFFENYDEFMEKGFEFIKVAYCQKCSFLGKEILVKNFEENITGVAKEINSDGTLKIEVSSDRYEIVRIGDLTC